MSFFLLSRNFIGTITVIENIRGLPAAYLMGNEINLPTERFTQALLQVGWMTEVTRSHGIKLVLKKSNLLRSLSS
ncbi:hypothetical protein AYI69_g7012 [Smittium culicis]|uniref:Uncharacterized protein n=1 Tax=Smittium culicis TaxID=133412 RepID=A0A1R1XV79_9FUNG|nr:hypothetical protein AYI69_g7012 [Smittium culicis]